MIDKIIDEWIFSSFIYYLHLQHEFKKMKHL